MYNDVCMHISISCYVYLIFYLVPLLHSTAEHIIILEGQSVDLECMPTPNHLVVSWSFDRLQSGTFDFNNFTFSPANLNHTLTISNPSVNYAGEYVCKILNSQVAVNRTITLEILPGNGSVQI